MSVQTKIKELLRRMNGEIPTNVLKKRGLIVGENFNRQQGCFIDPTHCFLISIGNNVTFSIRVCLLAHDASTKNFLGYTKIGKIEIGDNVFIGANTTILPDVTIGNNSIVGANSVVTKDIPENVVAAGNPARVICSLEDYLKKYRLKDEDAYFDRSYRYHGKIGGEKILKMKKATQDKIAYID